MRTSYMQRGAPSALNHWTDVDCYIILGTCQGIQEPVLGILDKLHAALT